MFWILDWQTLWYLHRKGEVWFNSLFYWIFFIDRVNPWFQWYTCDSVIMVFIGQPCGCNSCFLFWSPSWRQVSQGIWWYYLSWWSKDSQGRRYLIVTFRSLKDCDLEELTLGQQVAFLWLWSWGPRFFWYWGMTSVESFNLLSFNFLNYMKQRVKSLCVQVMRCKEVDVYERAIQLDCCPCLELV